MTRHGLTLIEALVAMFVAAIGMIAILTLFPLGALQMGQALKDGRCAQAAQQADGLIRWYWAKYEPDGNAARPIQYAFEKGDGGLPPITSGPSYPVLFDPLGTSDLTTWLPPVSRARVAGLAHLPRRTAYDFGSGPLTPAIINNPNTERYLFSNGGPFGNIANNNSRMQLRFSMLQDDLTYSEQSGAPAPGVDVERGGRYTWTWLLQRPDNAQRGIVDMKILVYDQRPPFYSNGLTETSYNIAGTAPGGAPIRFEPGSTSLIVPYGSGVRPPIQRGRWVCDATLNADGNPALPLRHANFYRVVSVNEDTPGFLYLELENPITRSDIYTNAYAGTLVVFNGLAEVFDRASLTDTATR